MPRGYRYITRDGKPPNKGTPPGVPRNDSESTPRGQFMAGQPVPNFITLPASLPPPPPGFQWMPAPPFPSAPFSAFVPGPAPVPLPGHIPTPPPPYAPPGQPSSDSFPVYGASSPAPGVKGGTASELPPGCRVRGELPVFPNKNAGYIFGKKQCTFNIVKGRIKPWQSANCLFQFETVHADCRMPIKEFIEQIDAAGRAPARASQEAIGICEMIEVGDGVWRKGSQYLLGDLVKIGQSLGDAGWDEFRGEAGMGKPVWLVVLP